jgi:hypothetical protein
MPAPHESSHDDHQLAQYLLGLLSDEEAECLDELSVVDEHVASRLRIAENDLVDAYVRGTMPQETRKRFESVYFSSASRRKRVDFAESFLKTVDRTPVTGAAYSGSGLRSLPRWPLAAAASILVLLAGSAALFSELRLRNGLQQLRSERAAQDVRAGELEQRLEDQRAANAQTLQELERVRTSLAELTVSAASGTARQAGAARTPIALVLPPQTRSTGPIVTLAIGSATELIAFDLLLETNEYPRYEAALVDSATDRVIWRSNRLAATTGEPTILSLTIPAAALKSQHYALQLTGHRPSVAAQAVSSYAFRIMRR